MRIGEGKGIVLSDGNVQAERAQRRKGQFWHCRRGHCGQVRESVYVDGIANDRGDARQPRVDIAVLPRLNQPQVSAGQVEFG